MRFGLKVALAVVVASAGGAQAGERYGPRAYDTVPVGGYPAGSGTGFAAGAIGGDYIGAPLTVFPRPSAIVPPVWGYGTYGVPTMTGIRQAPVGEPRVYVVRGVGPAPRRGVRPPEFGDASAAQPRGGAQVVSVTVPRR